MSLYHVVIENLFGNTSFDGIAYTIARGDRPDHYVNS
jgi:hypothetical protein